MAELDRTPPYLQVVQELRRRIAKGELVDGDRLPSMREISQEWGIANATALKALAALCADGLAESITGVGTIVRLSAKDGDDVYRIPSPEERGAFTACRGTQHCAYHGWCRRCAPKFAAVMSDLNKVIADAGVPDTYRGPLYHDIGEALMPYHLNTE